MLHQVVIKASEVHRAFGKLLKRIYGSDEHLIVERDGYPVAVLLSYQEYERLRRDRALSAFEQFSGSFGRYLEQSGITEEDLLTSLQEVKEEIYQERYGKRA